MDATLPRREKNTGHPPNVPVNTAAFVEMTPDDAQVEDLARQVERMLLRIAEGWRSAAVAQQRMATIRMVSADAERGLPPRF